MQFLRQPCLAVREFVADRMGEMAKENLNFAARYGQYLTGGDVRAIVATIDPVGPLPWCV